MKFKPFLAILIIFSHLFAFGQIPATTKETAFRDWNYSPKEVYGLIKLDDTRNRSYYKIVKIDAQASRIQSFNAAGILTYTTVIRYFNGKLNMMSNTDRWGDTYSITKYAPVGLNEFMVTTKSSGKNDFLPGKGARYIYKNNLLSEIRYISYDNKVTPNSSGVAIIKYTRYTDNKRYSLLNEMKFFDENNQPIISKNWDCHKVVYQYDEHGDQLSLAYYGIDNEAIVNRNGVFKSKSAYNDHDQVIRTESIGLNEELTNNAYGVAASVYEYHDGFQSKSIRYNQANTITKASEAGDGIAILKYQYDGSGNQTEVAYFDENEKPINNHSGYQKITYSYSPQNMVTSLAYYDNSGSPINNQSGIERYEYIRDEKGRVIQESYFDKSGAKVKDDQNEVYMVKYKYDESGQNISLSYWENENTKMNRWDGYHEQSFQYNDEGQNTITVYLDQSGNLFTGTSGFSRIETVYDANARESAFRYFKGQDPSTMENSMVNKFHTVKFFYDKNGRESSLEYYGVDDKPIEAEIELATDNKFSCQKIEFVYKANRIIEERLYKLDSPTPFKVIDCLKNDYVSTGGVSRGYKNQ